MWSVGFEKLWSANVEGRRPRFDEPLPETMTSYDGRDQASEPDEHDGKSPARARRPVMRPTGEQVEE